MPNLIDFRRRIRSVKNTQQITRAMKFVAAARLRRAQERVLASRPYARQILRVLQSAEGRLEHAAHPLLEVRPEKKLLAIVISADRGLCGAFNSNVLRKTAEFLREYASKKIELVVVGKRARDAMRRTRLPLKAELIGATMNVKFEDAKELAELAMAAYTGGEADAVYVIYNEFRNVLVQRLVVARLLPIPPEAIAAPREDARQEPSAGHGGAVTTKPAQVDYIYQQPPQEIFNRLVPRYVETEVYRALLESSAAEHAARMTAMDAATKNAADLIDSLTLHMNKVRQAAITKEIIEVVSGAASAV
ncbi:MAG TPA: ATP synthase F1 subunit gamma [Candidatus Acidoferrales bacterium]|nr:ATP synthase F1 subunit gamma [Candidatus Acidoferrales bacterium]